MRSFLVGWRGRYSAAWRWLPDIMPASRPRMIASASRTMRVDQFGAGRDVVDQALDQAGRPDAVVGVAGLVDHACRARRPPGRGRPRTSRRALLDLDHLRRIRRSSPTRAVLCRVRKIRSVPRSSLATICSFTFWWIGASTVAQKRVPMLMPSAPSASAATRPRPSPKPPEAIIGIFTLSAAAGIRIRPGMSSSPGMAGAFEAVDRDGVDAHALGRQRVAHRGALVDHLDAVRLEVGRRAPAACSRRSRRS